MPSQIIYIHRPIFFLPTHFLIDMICFSNSSCLIQTHKFSFFSNNWPFSSIFSTEIQMKEAAWGGCKTKVKRGAKAITTATMEKNVQFIFKIWASYQILVLDFTLGCMYRTFTDFIRICSYVLKKRVWLKTCNHITLKKTCSSGATRSLMS